ncbi:hypothetical protein A33Q_0114 [Indibacter alkaliphilus LW1]|uniref:Uncharacterized protein n=1 Tax=Indibacter alkaliphilus (strain CCUG 57479 / KCTC 22604 / LW1) TaxID=1189612 RepID=S2DMP4_INDAL|nr:hypothetical protein [Indibacter alkaliphilus]EPA00243.1 hypothetical protein A33Q_0114 [Indibacter alkaliphilus LW1]
MKNLIYLLPFLLLMVSACSKEEEALPNLGVFIDTSVVITILDEQGNNRLDPNHVRYLDPEDIKIFYEINGRLEEFYEDHLDMPRNFRINQPGFGRDYNLALFLSEKTVIQWNENESDSIEAEIYRSDDLNRIQLIKVYFNGDLKWDNASLTASEFTIIK